jgi:hypothetical protein
MDGWGSARARKRGAVTVTECVCVGVWHERARPVRKGCAVLCVRLLLFGAM